MRAKFVRGHDPKKAMGIGKYNSIWGKVEDFIRDKIFQFQKEHPTYFNYRFDNPEFFISEDGNSLGIYFPEGTPAAIQLLFQAFNNYDVFPEIEIVLEIDRAVGVNINSIDYSGFHIPDEKFIEGKMMEIYIHGV